MKTKIAAAIAALTIGVTALATTQAQAHHPHHGFRGFGIAGVIIGATIANDGYYYGCHWEPYYDRRGNYRYSVKVCG
jgi:hypothetical protein